MKMKIRVTMTGVFSLLLSTVFLTAGISAAEERNENSEARSPENAVQTEEVGPDTIVYCDALWMRVHAADDFFQ